MTSSDKSALQRHRLRDPRASRHEEQQFPRDESLSTFADFLIKGRLRPPDCWERHIVQRPASPGVTLDFRLRISRILWRLQIARLILRELSGPSLNSCSLSVTNPKRHPVARSSEYGVSCGQWGESALR